MKKKRGSKSGRQVALNPWIPAVPVKGRKLLKPMLVPLALFAGSASATLLPARALTIDADAAQQMTPRDYQRAVLAGKAEILRKYENHSAFTVAQGKRAGKGQRG